MFLQRRRCLPGRSSSHRALEVGPVVLIYPDLAFWFHGESTTVDIGGRMPCLHCFTVEGDSYTYGDD